MKKARFIILTIVFLGLIAGVVGYWQYNKPHRNATTDKVKYTLPANALFMAYSNNEKEAAKQYNNQLLQVSGTVREVATENNTIPMLILESEHPIFGVKCMFYKPIDSNLKVGQQLTIKGFCSGINGDVEMTRCAVHPKLD